MAIKIENSDLKSIKIGSHDIAKVMFDTNQIWPIDNVESYLTFSSPAPFRMRTYPGMTSRAPWDGTIEVSTDGGKNWTQFLHEIYFSSGTDNTILMRGIGNTKLTGQAKLFDFDGANISCSGNIENLLDWQTVKSGGHPIPARYGLRSMFSGCKNLISGPKLSTLTLSDGCLSEFYDDCTSLLVLPILSQASFPSVSCATMFYGCTSIKLSKEKTDIYRNEYRIPYEGIGTDGGYALSGMFSNTGGTFKGTPTINTTYYTSNEVV